MPQLEQIDTFLSQLIWLLITFTVLYFFLWKMVLPRIAMVLETRQNKIDDDLEKAGTFKTEAEGVLAAYERALADAHAEAQEALRQSATELGEIASSRQAELTEHLASEIDAAEARIEQAKLQAIGNIREVAADVARAATARLIGEETDDAALATAVDGAMAGADR